MTTRQSSNAPRISRRRVLGAVGVGSATTAFAVACGAAKKGTSKATFTTTQAGQPKYGGTFNAAQNIDPFNYDPAYKPLQNGPWDELAYNSLLTAKRGPSVKYGELIVQPSLASKWETPDGQTFTFHLHPDIKWQDLPPVNGRALTSADVKWSLEYQSRTGQFTKAASPKLPPSLNGSYYEGLDTVETPDPSTVVAHFGAPFVPFLNYMAEERNGVLAHEVYETYGNFTNHLIGSGPWQLDPSASQQGANWVMKKNQTYFLQGHPYIDEVNYLVIPDDATQAAAFRSKQIDLLWHTAITAETAPVIHQENPSAVMYQYSDNAGGLLFENVRKAPLNDVRIRKAIGLSIDRDAFIKSLSKGQGTWAVAGAVEGLLTPAQVKQYDQYDPAQAKQLVAAAGFPNGVPLELHYPGTARGQAYVSYVQLIQASLKNGNINVTLKPEDEATFSTNQRVGKFDLDYEAKPVVGDIDAYIYYNWHTGSYGNFGGVSDPKLDKLLEAQRSEVDAQKRQQILLQVVQYINDNAYYPAFYFGVGYFFWQSYLKNFAPNVIHWAPAVYDSWLEK